jgi:hypothetical protein
MVALGLLVTISGVGVAARLSDMEVLGGPVRAAVVRLASPQVPSQGSVGELAPEDGVPSSGDAESSLIVSPDSDGVMAEGSDVAGLEAPSLIDSATEELEAEDPEVEAVEESEKAASSQGGWLERSRSLWAKLRAPGFSGVNLRLAPSLSAAISKVLPVGAQVELMAKRAVAGGLAWRQVRTQGGEVGWVAEGAVDEE